MDQKTIRDMLPVIVAFAHGLCIQFRDLRRDGFYEDQGWMDINPETTEFRLGDDTNPQEWRVKPGQPAIMVKVGRDEPLIVGYPKQEGSGADPSMEDEDLVEDLKRKAEERHRRVKQWLGTQGWDNPQIIDDPTAPIKPFEGDEEPGLTDGPVKRDE